MSRFNHLPAELSRSLTPRGRRVLAESQAIEALERGLAFSEEDGLEAEAWSNDPKFAEALRAFGAMGPLNDLHTKN